MKLEFIPRLQSNIHLVNEQIKLIADADLSAKSSPKKWSKKEIFGHLIDSAFYNLQRFLEIQYKPLPYQVMGYSQNELVRANDYQASELSDLLLMWNSLNYRIITIIKHLKKEQFDYSIRTPSGERKDLKWLINDYINHLEHHLNQIFPVLGATETQNYRISVEIALKHLQKTKSPFLKVLEHGTMEVEIYQPDKIDKQTPHDRDELYVIIAGHGNFKNGSEMHSFQAGDVLFVSAGIDHRFLDFTDDFLTWVIFYGAIGGEVPKE